MKFWKFTAADLSTVLIDQTPQADSAARILSWGQGVGGNQLAWVGEQTGGGSGLFDAQGNDGPSLLAAVLAEAAWQKRVLNQTQGHDPDTGPLDQLVHREKRDCAVCAASAGHQRLHRLLWSARMPWEWDSALGSAGSCGASLAADRYADLLSGFQRAGAGTDLQQRGRGVVRLRLPAGRRAAFRPGISVVRGRTVLDPAAGKGADPDYAGFFHR